MKIFTKVSRFSYKKNRFVITAVLSIAVIILLIYSKNNYSHKKMMTYSKNVDKICAVVNGKSLTLRNFAFYVAYEEGEVEKQALVYDSKKPSKYWNLHMNGYFIKYSARNAAINMGIHDEIFYQKALKDNVKLTKLEKDTLKNNQEDFWNDLKEEGKDKKLGVSKKDIYDTMEKMAYAQKEQMLCEEIDGVEHGEYDFDQDGYKDLLKENNSYKIAKDVWQRLDFGNITLDH